MEWGTRRFRVLDTLARTIGESHSLRSFADEVESAHGTGHYPNVHEQLQRLEDDGTVSFEKAGRSKVPRLRFQRADLPDTMAALELWRKRALLAEHPSAREPLARVEDRLTSDERVRSVSLIAPQRNLRLRRLELLVLLHGTPQGTTQEPGPHREVELAERLSELEDDTALRVDAWPVPADDFADRLTSREASPAPRVLRSHTCVWNPQAFWLAVAKGLPHGTGLAPATPNRLSSLEEGEIAWNLSRWGYEERGRALDEEATALCPEAVAVAALAADVPRWIGAAAVVLSKADLDANLLAYLAKSEGQAGRLGEIVKILYDRDADPALAHLLQLLEALGIEPERIEQDMVADALDLYGD
jgi:hypothetical protein